MFNEATLRPPRWKVYGFAFLGVLYATLEVRKAALFANDPRLQGIVVLCLAVLALTFLFAAFTSVNTCVRIRAGGIEIKKCFSLATHLQWDEIAGIAPIAHGFHGSGGYGFSKNAGIVLAKGCRLRDTEDCESNRRKYGCDILLKSIYGMPVAKFADFLNAKKQEAKTFATQPQPAAAATSFVSAEKPPSPEAEDMPADINEKLPFNFDDLPCFESKCPSCMTVQTFRTQEPGWSEHIIRGGVRCPACKLTRTTQKDGEWEKLKQAALIWNQMQRGALTKKAAVMQVLALNSRILGRIAYESQTWLCKGCGAENPVDFTECWKCQLARPPRPPGEEDIVAADFDE